MKIKIFYYSDRENFRVRRSDWANDQFEVITPVRLDAIKLAAEQINLILPASIEVINGDE